MWQHTSSGCIWLQIGAVAQSGGCDCNIYHGSIDQLHARVAGTAAPKPQPKPQPPHHAPVNRFAGYATIKKGSQDPRTGPLPTNVPYDPHDYPVHVLQYVINAITGNPHRLAWDGVFGAATEDNVADFQRLMHCTVDGAVGPQTWAALSIVCDYKGL
jgi:peptidoglycan hydrolase-like protein with peptidoglycan-binding domain